LERKVDELIDQGKVIKTSRGNYEKIISWRFDDLTILESRYAILSPLPFNGEG
jgi:hypothetical protein